MSVVSVPPLPIARSGEATFWARVRSVSDFWSLTKPEVNLLIVIATFTGFYLGLSSLHPFPLERLLHVLAGTLLVASGAGALNQSLEYRFDAQMRRTARRPVAAGRLYPSTALLFGMSLAAVGAAYLLLFVNVLAGSLALITLVAYLFTYTPLKRKTPLCTVTGAFAGAMPPLIGWAAASGSIASAQAWTLYAMLFFWQFPHFMAIAWMYRDDYADAGYFVLPTRSAHRFLTWLTVIPSIGLFVASLEAAAQNSGRLAPLFATVILGLVLLFYVRQQIVLGSRVAARRLLKATVFYLFLEMLVLILAKH